MSSIVQHDTEPVDLRSVLELHDIRLYEVACRSDVGFKDDELAVASRARQRKNKEEGGSDQEEQHWDISIKVAPKRLECRVRVTVELHECRYLVDAVSIYRSSENSDKATETAVLLFIEREALPALYPYIRAEIHQAAVKIRGTRRVFKELTVDGVRKALANARVPDDAKF